MAISIDLNILPSSARNSELIVRWLALLAIALLAFAACTTDDQQSAAVPSNTAQPSATNVREESPTSVTTSIPTSTPPAQSPTATTSPSQITPPNPTPTTTSASPTTLSKLAVGTPIPADPIATTQPTQTPPPFTAPAATSTPQPTSTPPPTATPLSSGPIPQISAVPAFPNLHFSSFGDNTVFLTYPPDGSNRVVVVEKEGIVSIFENTASVSQTTTFLNISGRVAQNGTEEGLLGLAFHPNYAENGYFYVYYSAANPRRSILSRFTASTNPNIAEKSSELVILEVLQPYSNHNGGMIEFGLDGYLYVGLGDGGSGGDPHGNGQNTSTLLASILRIDIDNPSNGNNYGIPADNPFATSANGLDDPRPEIWAYGLRNPWRFSFDRVSGDLWVGDVGEEKWEEINIAGRGGNYGWNTMEGNHCFRPSSGCDSSGTILPIAEYDHSGRCSVTGGYVYRGAAIPELVGVYIYTDFCSGEYWGIRTNDRTTAPQLIASGIQWSPSFGQDAEGNLYILTLGGPIRRIVLAN